MTDMDDYADREQLKEIMAKIQDCCMKGHESVGMEDFYFGMIIGLSHNAMKIL